MNRDVERSVAGMTDPPREASSGPKPRESAPAIRSGIRIDQIGPRWPPRRQGSGCPGTWGGCAPCEKAEQRVVESPVKW